jgi:hypothetical protein
LIIDKTMCARMTDITKEVTEQDGKDQIKNAVDAAYASGIRSEHQARLGRL